MKIPIKDPTKAPSNRLAVFTKGTMEINLNNKLIPKTTSLVTTAKIIKKDKIFKRLSPIGIKSKKSDNKR